MERNFLKPLAFLMYARNVYLGEYHQIKPINNSIITKTYVYNRNMSKIRI